MVDMVGSKPLPASVEQLEGHCISIQLSHTITAKNVDGGIELAMPGNMKDLFGAMCDVNGYAEYVVQMSGQLYLKVKLLPGQTKAEGHFLTCHDDRSFK